MNNSIKMNCYQRGFIQHAVLVFISLVFVLILIYVNDYFFRARFIKLAKQSLQSNFINLNFYEQFLEKINTPLSIDNFLDILIITAFVILFFLWCLRFSLKINMISSIVLPKVIEFSTALRKLGILAPNKQIEYTKLNRIPIYTAKSSIINEHAENETVILYLPVGYVLNNPDSLNRFLGARKLCLNYQDYEAIINEKEVNEKSTLHRKVEEQIQQINGLNSQILSLNNDLKVAKDKEDKLGLIIVQLKDSINSSNAREKKANKQELRRIPFYRVASILITRLSSEAILGKKYTRPYIECEFFKEITKMSEIESAIREEAVEQKGSKDSLKGWAMEYIRTGLGDYVEKNGRSAIK